MTNLRIAKWGNSLAVRIPADYVRKNGIKEGDRMQTHLGVDGALTLRPVAWSRKAFAKELIQQHQSVPMGSSVMELLRAEARY